MKVKTKLLLALPTFLLTLTVLNPIVYAVEEQMVFDRNYVGLGAEVYARYQCYPGEDATFRVRVEALEDIKNVSVTLMIWGSKSEGSIPWGISFTVLDVTDFPSGAIEEKAYNLTIPSDVDSGVTYGILFLDWSIYRISSWEIQWDKASFRATYVKSKNYEDLQTSYNELQSKYSLAISDFQTTRTLMYVFLATTVISVSSTLYFAGKKNSMIRSKNIVKTEVFEWIRTSLPTLVGVMSEPTT